MELNGTIKKSFALSGAITREAGGGVSDYDLLSNRPQINSVTLTGNKSATDLGLVTASELDTIIVIDDEAPTDPGTKIWIDSNTTPVQVPTMDDLYVILPTDTVTNQPIASFPDGANAPVVDITIDINPVQSGSGTPAPDNIRPISGWTCANIIDDPAYGGFINWRQQVENGDFATNSGWAARLGTVSIADKIATVTASSAGTERGLQYNGAGASGNTMLGHKYFVSSEVLSPVDGTVRIAMSGAYFVGVSVTANVWKRCSAIWTQTTGAAVKFTPTFYIAQSVTQGSEIKYKNTQAFDLTEIFGAGNEPSTVEEFESLFPNDYYAYSATATKTCVSAVSDVTYNTIQIDFPSSAGTVYGGTLDVTTGVLTVTHGQIGSYAGESLPGEWISDRDVYAPGSSPTTGAQVVYELSSPAEYTLTPIEVKTFLGNNNIWADSGNVNTLEYRADIKKYIAKVVS